MTTIIRHDSSALLEYQRMREEKEIKDMHDNVPVIKSMFDVPGIQNVKPATKETDNASPGGDTVDGVKPKAETHLGASEHPGHRHGAKLCMISAIVHMKRLAGRKPKSIQELRKNPLTTQEESALKHEHDGDSESDDETQKDSFAHLRKCRYLRGNDEHELSIEEIFH